MKKIALFAVIFAVSACSTTRYAYHAVYTLSGCEKAVTTDELTQAMIQSGFYLKNEKKGPYSVFHKPNIVKKAKLAIEPFENQAGEFGVAVCNPRADLKAPLSARSTIVVTEEWRACENQKDCTEQDQKFVKKVAENWKCKVQERSGHSKSWELEERQDWTAETCQQITNQLSL